MQVVPNCPSCLSCLPIAAGTMLGIYILPVVALCCSAHVCCAVERGIACCAIHYTAIATLTLPFEPVYGVEVETEQEWEQGPLSYLC